MKKRDFYADCTQPRTKPSGGVNEELSKKIALNYRTLPTFEKTLFDEINIKHYSLKNNKLLDCRWAKYQEYIEERVHEPFMFPDHRDLHFYNGCIRFKPDLSIRNIPDYRMRLKPGPGVDLLGQMPIPNDLMMKRGTAKKEQSRKRITKKKEADKKTEDKKQKKEKK